MKIKLVLLRGEAMHGKDTFAEFFIDELAKHSVPAARVAHGDFIKLIAGTYYGWDGTKDDVNRAILQNVGTEYALHVPTIWIDMVRATIRLMQDKYKVFIVTDCRKVREFEHWDPDVFDVVTVAVHRPGFDNGFRGATASHTSETAVMGYPTDHTFYNTSLLEFEEVAREFAHRYL